MTKSFLHKISTIFMFSFILFSVVYSFEEKSYTEEKKITFYIKDALFSIEDKAYYGVVEIEDEEKYFEIGKSVFDRFHNEGQTKSKFTIQASEEYLELDKPASIIISLTLAISSLVLLAITFLVSFFVKENK